MTVQFTDNFDGRTENPLASGWETITTYGLQCTGGVAKGHLAGYISTSGITTAQVTLDNDHYISLVIANQNSFDYIGPAVRLTSDGGGRGYVIQPTSSGFYLQKMTSGALPATGSALDSYTGLTPATGQLLVLEAIGTTINGYINGILRLTAVDASYSDGQVGMWSDSQNSNSTTADTVEAGDYAVGTTPTITFDGTNILLDTDKSTAIASMTDVSWEVYNTHAHAPRGSLLAYGTAETITSGELTLTLNGVEISSSSPVRVSLQGTILAGSQSGKTALREILTYID